MDQNGNNYQVYSGSDEQIIINLYNDRLKDPHKSLVPASIKMNVSIATVMRRLKRYAQLGPSSFIHGNTGRTPVNKIDFRAIKDFIAENQLEGTNFATLERVLSNRSEFKVSSSCLRKRSLAEGILSPQCTKLTRKKLRKKLEKKLEQRGALSSNETDRIQKIPDGFDSITEEQINQCLVVIKKRVVHKGFDITYKKTRYRLISQDGRLKCLPQGTSVSIIRTIDDADLYATDKKNNVYILEHIDFAKAYSDDYDPDEMKPKKTKKREYSVSPCHPWSYAMQMQFKSKNKLMKSPGTYL